MELCHGNFKWGPFFCHTPIWNLTLEKVSAPWKKNLKNTLDFALIQFVHYLGYVDSKIEIHLSLPIPHRKQLAFKVGDFAPQNPKFAYKFSTVCAIKKLRPDSFFSRQFTTNIRSLANSKSKNHPPKIISRWTLGKNFGKIFFVDFRPRKKV